MNFIQHLTCQFSQKILEQQPIFTPCFVQAGWKEREARVQQQAAVLCAWGQVGKAYVGRRRTQTVTMLPKFAVVPKLIPLVKLVQGNMFIKTTSYGLRLSLLFTLWYPAKWDNSRQGFTQYDPFFRLTTDLNIMFEMNVMLPNLHILTIRLL